MVIKDVISGMKRSKNVLEIINLFGSATNFIGGQFSYLREHGYNMHLICSPDPGMEEFAKEQRIKCKGVALNRQISVMQDLRAYFEVCKYIKHNKIDTIIAHQAKARLIAMLAGFTMRVPNRIIFAHGVLYETMHGLKRKIFIFIDKIVAAMAHKVVCVSPSVMKVRLRDHINKPEKQCLLNKGTCGGIDTKVMFNPATYSIQDIYDMKCMLGIHNAEFVLGFCGRIVRDKGIVELIEGFKQLKSTYPDKNIKLLFIGEKEIRDAVPQDTIDIIENDHDIVFTGRVDRSQMPKYYLMMDAFILPSYREGYPTVILEGMSMGVPCIVSRSTGCIDSIVENYNGIYTEISPESIMRQIVLLLDSEFRKKLAANTRSYIVDNYDYSKVWPAVIDVIEK